MLRGNYAAKIDDKARLKIPNAFRALVEKTHGSELFVTSLTGESVQIYPMPVWLALEERLAGAPSTLPSRKRFLDRVSYYGQAAEIDTQGRVMDTDGRAIAGLHAAGELVGGLFYFNYPGGTGLMAGSVFGRIAGTTAGQRAAQQP